MENLSDPDDLAACTVVTDNCAMVIVAPLEGSPAEAAGLRPGDHDPGHRRRVDRRRIGQLARVRRARRGRYRRDAQHPPRRRGGGHHRHPRGDRPPGSPFEMLEDGIGYIKLTSFTDRATGHVPRRAVRSCSTRARPAFVFDLRGNPGGYIAAAQGIARQFVPSDELLFTVESGERRPGVAVGRRAAPGRHASRLLVNGGLGIGFGDRRRGAAGPRARHDRRRADVRQEHGPDLARPSERRRPAPHD